MSGPRPMWMAAAAMAARGHRHQMRRDGVTPYAAHPFRVALIVRDLFGCGDEVALTAALLHDLIEDTGVDFDDIESAFGSEVAACVAALSKNMILSHDRREAEYDERLARADWRARLVKLADTYDNLCDRADDAPGTIRSSIDKCARAVALARPDAAEHEPTARAITFVESLMRDSA